MNINIFDDITAGENQDSGWVKVSNRKFRSNDGEISIQFGHNSLDATDGNLTVYYSNDPSDTKESIEMFNLTLDSATSSKNMLIQQPIEYLKLIYTKNSNTSGTIYAYLSKGNR